MKAPNPIKLRSKKPFVDRTDTLKQIKEIYENLYSDTEYFKVAVIHGMGGIGKTRLLNEIKNKVEKKFKDEYVDIIHVSFEIEKSHQSINNLLKIRKNYKGNCTIFDYALITYWAKTHVEKLDDEFSYKIRSNFCTDLLDFLNDTGISKVFELSSEIAIGVPSVSSIFDLIGKILRRVDRFRYKNELVDIPELDTFALELNLPYYLGLDIKRNLERNKLKYFFLFLDSYQQSLPYSESKEWLKCLISTIGRGVFFVTGREKLQWQDVEGHIRTFQLLSYPETAARDLLGRYIKVPDSTIIDTIIKSSQCVPFFVDMSIDVYLEAKKINSERVIPSVYFSDRDTLIRQFINHLPEKWHDLLLFLSVIHIFNERIFEEIIRRFNIQCPFYDYETLIKTSISKYVENSYDLIKLHDVFCSQASNILSHNEKILVWKAYLEFIHSRESHLAADDHANVLIILFANLLRIREELQIELTPSVNEKLLDIFFVIIDIKARFIPPGSNIGQPDSVNELLQFFNAVIHEKENTTTTVQRLNSIKNSFLFGKHQISFRVIKGYVKSLQGDYDIFKNDLISMNDDLNECDERYWYYNKIKIYLSDFQIMDGQFKLALANLKYLENRLTATEDIFLTERSIGHIYRFNMLLNMAEEHYSLLLETYTQHPIYRNYFQTTLCETCCYFKPEYVENNFEFILQDAITLGNLKNQGKLYYSMAIVQIRKGNFWSALANIRKSIDVNKQDGYKSGILFAYMSQAFYDYALFGRVKKENMNNIRSLLAKNKVYSFFELILYKMEGREDLAQAMKDNYEWLDFDETIRKYEAFLQDIITVNTSHLIE